MHLGSNLLLILMSLLQQMDRFDHAPTTTQELSLVHALERLMGWYGSIHDPSLRTMFLEFHRIPNHSSAITTHAIDTGLFTTTPRPPEEREKLINFPEEIPGNRFHAAFLSIGRPRYDVSSRRTDRLPYRMIQFGRKLKEVHNISPKPELRVSRQYEIGIIERQYCSYSGFPGLLPRAPNIPSSPIVILCPSVEGSIYLMCCRYL